MSCRKSYLCNKSNCDSGCQYNDNCYQDNCSSNHYENKYNGCDYNDKHNHKKSCCELPNQPKQKVYYEMAHVLDCFISKFVRLVNSVETGGESGCEYQYYYGNTNNTSAVNTLIDNLPDKVINCETYTPRILLCDSDGYVFLDKTKNKDESIYEGFLPTKFCNTCDGCFTNTQCGKVTQQLKGPSGIVPPGPCEMKVLDLHTTRKEIFSSDYRCFGYAKRVSATTGVQSYYVAKEVCVGDQQMFLRLSYQSSSSQPVEEESGNIYCCMLEHLDSFIESFLDNCNEFYVGEGYTGGTPIQQGDVCEPCGGNTGCTGYTGYNLFEYFYLNDKENNTNTINNLIDNIDLSECGATGCFVPRVTICNSAGKVLLDKFGGEEGIAEQISIYNYTFNDAQCFDGIAPPVEDINRSIGQVPNICIENEQCGIYYDNLTRCKEIFDSSCFGFAHRDNTFAYFYDIESKGNGWSYFYNSDQYYVAKKVLFPKNAPYEEQEEIYIRLGLVEFLCQLNDINSQAVVTKDNDAKTISKNKMREHFYNKIYKPLIDSFKEKQSKKISSKKINKKKK